MFKFNYTELLIDFRYSIIDLFTSYDYIKF